MFIYLPVVRLQKLAKIKSSHKRCHGSDINLKNPLTLNEKIQWLKLNYKDSNATECADKVTARDIVAKKIGQKYLIPSLGIYERAQEIDWKNLPQQFVIKVSDGYAQNIICVNKKEFNIDRAISQLKDWLKPTARHYWAGYEWQYKHCKPKIIIEKYMGNEQGQIDEYKFMYLSNELAFIVVEERTIEDPTRFHQTFFDANWRRIPVERVGHEPSNRKIMPPKTLQEMLKVSSKLARGFPICRVDLYEVDETVKLGELTFTPANGMAQYLPDDWNLKLGKMVNLPRRNNYDYLEWKPTEIIIRTKIKNIVKRDTNTSISRIITATYHKHRTKRRHERK